MWFVFPQLDGLGHSPTARHYAIHSLDHARRYAADPVLGPRLQECLRALLDLPPAVVIDQVLGSVDAMKLRSCATLFARAGADGSACRAVLSRFYAGEDDATTLRLLARAGG
jgi:uncharacterized protein (DUF1810 family)